ncbi:serine protease, subtilase family [Streptomyces hygroscopicus subsp. jinggangensis 5008]|nr:serine protease, subtilase family [Streptomyces hygroscopicus subsp. jinggangensis 5008]AGF61169.1 serine protease, subtilase family [Streptomyces hygroscopicus subsp. jinggangensis TL01]
MAFTFASGDNAGVTQYPAASPYVTAVGGTTLTRAQNPRGWAESAGNGTGSGCSLLAPKPAFQHDTTSANRTTADASAVADNFAVYDTFPFNGSTGWFVANGASISAPAHRPLRGGQQATDNPPRQMVKAAHFVRRSATNTRDSRAFQTLTEGIPPIRSRRGLRRRRPAKLRADK